ncbi:WXG100 family type VII secretion target [Rhodococcus sp. NPDC056743]|uniref:WXG100 family type VII secretion target n=1 Tax=Rhodococcus sp. NPDC056743 TaxID=3345934 RepID=UPI00366ABC4B
MSELWIDVQVVRALAPRFVRLAEDLERSRADLEQEMTAEGPSWGSDEAGSTFADAYLPGSESVLAGISMMAGVMRNLTDALYRTSDNFEGVDAELADNFAGGL